MCPRYNLDRADHFGVIFVSAIDPQAYWGRRAMVALLLRRQLRRPRA